MTGVRWGNEHTIVIDTVIDDFVPLSSITSSIFSLQYVVENRGSQYTQPDIDENNPIAQSIPRLVLSAVLWKSIVRR